MATRIRATSRELSGLVAYAGRKRVRQNSSARVQKLLVGDAQNSVPEIGSAAAALIRIMALRVGAGSKTRIILLPLRITKQVTNETAKHLEKKLAGATVKFGIFARVPAHCKTPNEGERKSNNNS